LTPVLSQFPDRKLIGCSVISSALFTSSLQFLLYTLLKHFNILLCGLLGCPKAVEETFKDDDLEVSFTTFIVLYIHWINNKMFDFAGLNWWYNKTITLHNLFQINSCHLGKLSGWGNLTTETEGKKSGN
jgi:hypothetical protein